MGLTYIPVDDPIEITSPVLHCASGKDMSNDVHLYVATVIYSGIKRIVVIISNGSVLFTPSLHSARLSRAASPATRAG